MNVLFLLRSFGVSFGGIEMVTLSLANQFQKEGINVTIFSFIRGEIEFYSKLNPSVKVVFGDGYNKSSNNLNRLRECVIENKIDICINQMGLQKTPIKMLQNASKDQNLKVISVYHNDPLQNGRIQEANRQLELANNPFSKVFFFLKRFMYRCATGVSMRYVYNHSDLFEVLSNSYISHFCKITKIKHPNHLIAQANPVTIEKEGFSYQRNQKKKDILYVGRMDEVQKRVSRLLDVWKLLNDKSQNWRMVAIGDGPELEALRSKTKKLGVERFELEGSQHPRSYYENASLLILTSDFEGFPLVLAEAMSYGVVPVVYGSFAAVYDIIEDGKDGIIIPKTKDGFSAELMAQKLKTLMESPETIDEMAKAAMEKSKQFDIEIIGEQWIKVFDKIMKYEQ